VPAKHVVFDELRVRTLLDGETQQDGSVREMIFSVGAIIAFVTQFMTLERRLNATGTPSGFGPMQAAPCLIEITGIGVLQNQVVAAQHAAAIRRETSSDEFFLDTANPG